MKRIFFLLAICAVCVSATVRAQGVSSQEMEENYKSLRGKLQDMIEAQAAYEKRIQALEREISDLREQIGKPNNSYATRDDLKRLGESVQEVDRKRDADYKHVADELAKLGKSLTATPTPIHEHKAPVTDPTPAPQGSDDGFTYQIKSGDTLGLIAQAYREQQGIKVSVSQIVAANPGLDPNKLLPGKKIFIPAPKTTASK
jgi:LysM repeat protein